MPTPNPSPISNIHDPDQDSLDAYERSLSRGNTVAYPTDFTPGGVTTRDISGLDPGAQALAPTAYGASNPGGYGNVQGIIDFIKNGGKSGQFSEYNNSIQPGLRAAAGRVQAANPYTTPTAGHSAALSALSNMRDNTLNGPSAAGLMGSRAMGSNLQAALGAGGGRAVANRASGAGAGLAAAGASGRLGEVMAGQTAASKSLGDVRGADIESANNSVRAGQKAQALADQNSQAYAGMGVNSAEAARRNALEQYKLLQRLIKSRTTQAQGAQDGVMQGAGSILSIFGL